MKRLVAATFVVAVLASACGGDGDTTNPAAFGAGQESEGATEVCNKVPVNVPSIEVLGQRVAGFKDIELCVEEEAAVGLVPKVKNQPQCGNPCFTVEVESFNIAADVGLVVKINRTTGEVTEIKYDPDKITAGPEQGRLCIAGVGDPWPCAERITTPTNLTASAGKSKIKLGWGASEDTGGAPLVGYEVWGSTTGQEGTFGYIGSVAETKFVHTGLSKGQTYYYYVVALDGDGNRSEASNVAQAASR